MGVGGVLLYLELLLLFVAFLPLGDVLVRVGERFLGRSIRMTLVERAVVSLYVAGGFLFVLASLPIAWFSESLVVVAFVAGALLWCLDPGSRRDLRSCWSRLRTGWPGAARLLVPTGLVASAVLLLLVFEVTVVGGMALPNSYDGSVQTEFTQVLLRQGSVGTTLLPYADAGIIYPQGTTVWLATGVLLFKWPVADGSVYLTPLFLALGVAGAYCWGRRLGGVDTRAGQRGGLVFAAVFASLGTWPRFLVGGSYDFALAIPLFLVLLGWLEPLWQTHRGSWRPYLLFALLVGVLASLSVACAELLVVLVAVIGLRTLRPISRAFLPWAGRVALIAGLGALFVVRSLIEIIVWWGYPGHVLTEIGGPLPPAPPPSVSPLLALVGLMDPFLFRPIDVWLSPFPLLKLELAALFASGLFLLLLRTLGHYPMFERDMPRAATVNLLGTTAATAAVLGVIVLSGIHGSGLSAIVGVSSSGETSILLFVFYTAIAALPLLWAAGQLDRWLHATRRATNGPTPKQRTMRSKQTSLDSLGRGAGGIVLAVLVLSLPLISGTAVTVTEAPAYMGDLLHDLSNVSQGDLEALQWAGNHLTACSGVLVAPGSAGQFLPAYSDARLIYPMDPSPQNLSYIRVVANLTFGNYTATVRSDLLALQTTEVLVTGETNVLWKPFATAEMTNSADFRLLFQAGDASIFQFLPGTAALGCGPVTVAPAVPTISLSAVVQSS